MAEVNKTDYPEMGGGLGEKAIPEAKKRKYKRRTMRRGYPRSKKGNMTDFQILHTEFSHKEVTGAWASAVAGSGGMEA